MLKKYYIIFLIAEILSTGHLLSQPTLEWVRQYPENFIFNSGSETMVLDDSGNVYITGYCDTPSVYFNGYCTIKYSSTGVLQWIAKYFGIQSGGRFSYAIALDSAYNVYVTGYSYNASTYFDYCTVKYSSNGTFQWAKYYDGLSHGLDKAQKIGVDRAGNVYVTGFSFTPNGYQIVTVKYSTEGNEIWVQRSGTPDAGSCANGLAIDDSCYIYIAGGNNSEAFTLKLDSSGTPQWMRTYIGNITSSQANDIELDEFNNVYICGYSNQYSNSYAHIDYFTLKYTSSGFQQWVRRFNNDTMSNSFY